MRIKMLRRSNQRVLWSVAGGLGAMIAARAAVRRFSRLDLTDKVVLITGGSRGLGFLLAREFAHKGCRVVICARDEQELQRAAKDLQKTEAEVMAVACDVSRPDDVKAMVDRVVRRFGHVDILVNNAGVIQVGPVESMTPDDFRNSMQVMFWGVFHPTMAVLPHMRGRGQGRIVNITSIGGKVSVPHLLPYGCAKFAAVGFSEGLHAEVARHGIRVVTVVPGLMRTGSYINAYFKGAGEDEYVWFSLGATLPGISMGAERAARRIVRATRNGESEVTLSLPAKILARFHGLFPGLTADLLALADRLLPEAEYKEAAETRGMEVEARLGSRAHEMATKLGQKAAERYHEEPAGRPPRMQPHAASPVEQEPEKKEPAA